MALIGIPYPQYLNPGVFYEKKFEFCTSPFFNDGGVVICIVFTACENFLDGAVLKKSVEKEIEWEKAESLSVLVTPEEGTGSTVPFGNYDCKLGYFFEVSFTENNSYSFIKWAAVCADNLSEEIEGVLFEDASSPKTTVKFARPIANVRILPVCTQRIAVSGEPSPRYEPNGVARDRSISVTFTKDLSEENFIFQPEELPQGAVAQTDDDGKIWAYVSGNQTFLKNISITNADDFSIAEHFSRPQVNGRLLTIPVDKTKPIQFNSGEVFKTIKVTLSKEISDSDNIKMNYSKSWNYLITEATDEKATVNLSGNSSEGSVYLAGTKDYSLGQKITLAFTENTDWQFIKWDYDSSVIYIDNPESINTTAVVLEKTTEDNPTQIRAVCARRLRLAENGYEPKTVGNETVSKNSSIQLTFDQNLPADTEDLAQLANLSITVGGTPVRTCFNAPVISGNTVSFTANKSNMLDVTEGQTKTVTVTIPADFYYKLDDGTKVTWGGNGFAFDYRIDSTTTQKASVVFEMETDSGTITPVAGLHEYSEGQEVAVSFVPADGWEFRGWTVKTGAGDDVPASTIKILDPDALSTKLIVYEALSDVKIRADAVLLPAVSSFNPAYESGGKDCDTPVVIIFNKAMKTDTFNLYSEADAQGMKGTIKIVNPSNEYEHYEEYFNAPSWSADGKTLTLKPKNTIRDALVKNDSDLRNIRIVFDISKVSDTDGNKLKEADASWVYRINHSMETIAPTVTMKMYKRGFNIEEQSVTDSNNPDYPRKYYAMENNSFTELSNAVFNKTNGFSASANYPLNHVGTKVYFDALVSDEGSGYKHLTINEKQIKTADGNDANGAKTYTKTIELDEDSFDNAIAIFDEQGNINLHSYTLQTSMDGVIQLDFVFEDYAGNTEMRTWYVIKDTTINITEVLNPKLATFADKISTNGKIIEKFDYSACKDTYYSGYSTDCAYYLWSGTAENNAVFKGNKKIITFERNVSDYCYVWITACDSLGNIKTIKRLIPKQFELGEIYLTDTSYMYRFIGVNELEEKQKKLGAVSTVSGCVSICRKNDVYDESNLSNPIPQGYFVQFSENGRYKIYFTVGLQWGESYYYWAPMYGPYYIDYPIIITDSQGPDFPDTFSFTPDLPLEKNTGFVQMHTIFPENFTKTEGYEYGVHWNYAYDVKYEKLDFKVKSWLYSMPVYLFAKNIDSGKIYISENSVNISTRGENYDNVPPNCNGLETYYCSWPNMMNNIYIAEYENDLYKNSDGQYEMEYYLIKKDNTSMSFDSICLEDLQLLQNEKILCPYYASNWSGSRILLNEVPFIESYYDLIINARDNKENCKIYQGVYSNITSSEFPKLLSCVKDQENAAKTCITSCIKTITEYGSYGISSFCNLTNNNVWTVVGGVTQNSENNYTTSINNCPSGFLMIRYKGYKNAKAPFVSSLYNFLCPEYETKTKQEKDQLCKSKSVIPGLGAAYQVYYDAPCFAHTMAFPTDMQGDLDAKLAEAKSIDSTVDDETYIKAIWETKGREYGLKLINSAWLDSASTATYTAPVSEIPAGYSYVSIFHFADGTSVMSEVKQK